MAKWQAVEIYGLYDPRSGALRYIGKAKDSRQRLKGHIRDSRKRHTPVYCWMRGLREAGHDPEMRVLALVQEDQWQQYERQMIADARNRNERLLNIADGGDQPHCPRETRSANAKKLNDRLANDQRLKRIQEIKRHMGAAIRQGWLSESAKGKLRLAAAKNPALFGEYASL